MNNIPFNHVMAAHCESGTVTALLNHHGLKISEPMVFGISGAIFFGYMKMPMLTFPSFFFRSRPGQIRTKLAERTGIEFKTATYRNQAEAEAQLDRLLEQGQPVAVQVDFFYMDYFPAYYRVHINVHFINVIGKKENKYLISDSYHHQIAELDSESLMKGRFTRGTMAPKGFMFYPVLIPENINIEKAIVKGIKSAAFNMLSIPLPFLGVKGIRRFADKITEWPKYARDNEHLAHEIFKINVMLEDQGTGGAGFRYMYASFLREASDILKKPALHELSGKMMEIGDGWREISLHATRLGKSRELGNANLRELGEMIRKRADLESDFFNDLKKAIS